MNCFYNVPFITDPTRLLPFADDCRPLFTHCVIFLRIRVISVVFSTSLLYKIRRFLSIPFFGI